VLTVIDKTTIRDHPREMVAFTLAVAFGCSIAGLATPSGGARNVIAIGFLQQYGLQIDYLDWVVLAAPITLALMPLLFVTLILANQLRNRSLDYHLPPAEPLRDRQLLALGILGGTFLLFLTSGRTGLTLGTVAMLGAIAMHVSGVLEWDDSRRRLRWGVMFIYGAALTLGAAMVDHGVAEWLALGIFGLVEGGGELLLFSVIILLGVALTNIMSDGAAAAVLVPITLAVGVAAELDLAVVAILTAISTAFAFMTAFGTPPNLIVHASGIPSSADFVRNGVPMVLLAVLVLLVAQRYYWPIALGWTGL
jgi:sodium-dependent dicarboxylate transporter 2/3/5